jgi:hypothetical protein
VQLVAAVQRQLYVVVEENVIAEYGRKRQSMRRSAEGVEKIRSEWTARAWELSHHCTTPFPMTEKQYRQQQTSIGQVRHISWLIPPPEIDENPYPLDDVLARPTCTPKGSRKTRT